MGGFNTLLRHCAISFFFLSWGDHWGGGHWLSKILTLNFELAKKVDINTAGTRLLRDVGLKTVANHRLHYHLLTSAIGSLYTLSATGSHLAIIQDHTQTEVTHHPPPRWCA